MSKYEIAGRKVDEILNEMTLEEKASFCDGQNFWYLDAVERLGIPAIMVCDGPHGLRKQAKGDEIGIENSVPAVCFPTACTSACSWDRGLLYEMGEALGEKCLSERVSVILGPGVNMKRSPLCGRNFEYFSEDPFLAGELAAEWISGVQSKGVGTSMKHFAVNNQEERRMTVSAVVDERALREIYLTAFEIAVKKAKPWTLMNSYNRINGEHGSENDLLQNQILRDEWGFNGVVMTDWGAANDRVKGLKNGNDLEMPSSRGLGKNKIIEAVKNGELEEGELNLRVERLLELVAKSMPALEEEHRIDETAHHQTAKRIADASMVLLKNKNNLLPLNKEENKKIAVIGGMAKEPRYQGAGSSLINPTELDDFCDCLDEEGISYSYAEGYERTPKDKSAAKRLMLEAVEKAQEAEIVLLFIGLTEDYESEGFDRANMKIAPEHTDLLDAVYAVNKNLAVIISGGSPIEMPWENKASAILNAYLPGQAGANSIFDILFGKVNPSGKLAETIPFTSHCPASASNFPGNPATVEYRESVYIGYRYFDTFNKEVRYPFGFGLSYTSFEYSDLKLSKTKMKDFETLEVSFKIKNTGKRAGAESAQVYVSDKESTIFRPEKELKGFDKVYLEPGEEKEITVRLDKRAFAYYNVNIHDWHVENGSFEILIGASSADIRLSAEVEVVSERKAEVPDYRKSAPVYYNGDVSQVPDEEFEILLGSPIPPSRKQPSEPIGMTDNFENARHTKWGGRIYNFILKAAKRFVKGPNAGMMVSIVLQTPFRCFVSMSGGLFSQKMADGLFLILNGDAPGRGLWQIISGIPHLLFNIKAFLKEI